MKKFFLLFLTGMMALYASDIETISKTDGVLSTRLLQHFKELFDLHSFIETGTYAGDTTASASKVFEEVHSIEIFEPLYKRAEKRFANTSNVTLYFGDTTTYLTEMIQKSSAKRLYWLDAHSSGGGTGGIPGFSPILDELHQIYDKAHDFDSIILIDDLRGMCHCDHRTTLPLRLILKKINEVDPHLQFYSIGDIGIIFNEKTYPSISISETVKKASISRFFDPACEDEKILETLLEAEAYIASIPRTTEEEKNFGQLIKCVNKSCLGGETLYLLWEGLRELETNQLSSAIDDLQLVADSFYSHWRIDAYLVKALIVDGQREKAVSLFNKKLLPAYGKYPQLLEKILGPHLLSSLHKD